jgi:peptidoglycan hydrolase CwlO-like protein
LAASTGLLAEMEVQRDRAIRNLEIRTKNSEDLARQCADLKTALRNAESDLRATQKIIGNFERNQQQDRDEIRQSQKRIEGFVAEIALLKSAVSRRHSSDKKTNLEELNRNS